VEQLGGATQDVRFGGLYALEQIYTESERDRSRIVDVIEAFARSHLPPQSPLPDIPEKSRPRRCPATFRLRPVCSPGPGKGSAVRQKCGYEGA
jgi:hypothetical protein